MFIDASALPAILLAEPDADQMADAIEKAHRRYTSPIALFETIASLMSKKDLPRDLAEEQVHVLLSASAIETVAITDAIGRMAVDAFDRYGKVRRHPAQLNMGGCFAYARAKARGTFILYKGADFAQTDLA